MFCDGRVPWLCRLGALAQAVLSAVAQILEQDEETAGETTIFDYMKGLAPFSSEYPCQMQYL
jgi:hypothetical protein